MLFEDIGGDYNIPLAANAKSVREFDDGLTRGTFPYLIKLDHICELLSARTLIYKALQFLLDSSLWMNTTLIQAVQIP